ncbi:hypothetical protein D6829_00950 [Candidatus Pacearchaeota archaeon]|nr:MAG: hypothetical protein D6829_00950 [Candidatus Pacearchaeota archaeon]
MELGKRGIFFTLTAIALLSLALISFSILSISKQRHSISKRVETLNSFVHSLEEDMKRKLYISGFRIIFLFEKRIVRSGAYISDAENASREAFFQGTIDGSADNDEQVLLDGVKFSDIKNDVLSLGRKLNLEVSLENPSLEVYQKNPWFVHLKLTTNFSARDINGLASWNKTLITEADVPVIGFEDPLYVLNTNGKVFQKINRTPYKPLVSGSDVTNLTNHVNGGFYIASNKSPSFLNRLEGNFSWNDFGIESLVNIPLLSSLGIEVYDKSVVDSVYFSNSNPTSHNIQGMPPWFKIDDDHLEIYNLTGLTT